jgi:hypothetical protein
MSEQVILNNDVIFPGEILSNWLVWARQQQRP